MMTSSCQAAECPRETYRLGLCQRHYFRQWRYGDPLGAAPPRRRAELTGQRFGLLVARERLEGGLWLADCDCGARSQVRTWNLTSGSTRACNSPEHQRRGDAGYHAAHDRLKRARGPARSHPCVDCGVTAQQWSYDHRDPDELVDEAGHVYSLDPDRYAPRCITCHKGYDLAYLATARPAAPPPAGVEQLVLLALTTSPRRHTITPDTTSETTTEADT